MSPDARSSQVNRRVLLSTLALLPTLSELLLPLSARAQTAAAGDLLPSWNDGPAKQAILDFVRTTIERSSPSYVSPEDRIAVFDQDGTLWVEASHVHASGLLPGARSGGGGQAAGAQERRAI
jgi:hypothetical protein